MRLHRRSRRQVGPTRHPLPQVVAEPDSRAAAVFASGTHSYAWPARQKMCPALFKAAATLAALPKP
jgi:hypothetical protein